MKDAKQTPEYEIRVIERSPGREDPFGRAVVFDLLVRDGTDSVLLADVASTKERAEMLRRLFSENGVGPVEAPYIMEDLLSDPDFLE